MTKKTIYPVLFLCMLFSARSFSQMKIGASTAPAAASVLELESTTQGFVLPRVSLTSTTSNSPLGATILTSTMVYNTNAAITGGSGTGLYYWDGSKWNFLANSNSLNSYWSTSGNSGTTSPTNFLGTTDNNGISFKTNNTWRMSIDSLGSVAIGTTAFDPLNREKFLVDCGTTTSDNMATFQGSIPNYLQLGIQNLSNNANASTDFVATADNGTDSTNYIDMGINSSTYAPGVENFGGPNDGYLYVNANRLIIGTQSASDIVYLQGGGFIKSNQTMRLSAATGNIIIGRDENQSGISPIGNTIRGPNAGNSSPANSAGGSLTLQGGSAVGTGTGGAVNINGGIPASGTNGPVNINTTVNGATNINTGTSTGNVSIGNSADNILFPGFSAIGGVFYTSATTGQIASTGAGTSGYVLQANGAGAAPTWVSASSLSSGWQLSGNTGTTPGTNYVGTTDAQSLYFKVNGTQAGYLQYNATAANANTTFGLSAAASNSSTAVGAASAASGTNSLAVGNSASASTNYSTVVGASAASNATNSVAVGYSATANSNNSVSLGNQATASSQQSVSVGSNTSVSGNNAIAIGYQTASAYQATAVGSNAAASNNQAASLGYAASAAYQGTAIGAGTIATANQSTALGYTASATGTNSTAIGYGATTSQNNALVLGNSSVSVGIQTNTPARALEVGGTANTIRVDGLKSGNTFNSSSTASTSTMLYSNNGTGDIYALPTTNSAILVTNSSGVPSWSTTAISSTAWQLLGNTGITQPAAPATYGTSTFGAAENWIGNTDAKDFAFGTSDKERMRITSTGNVGIGTATPATLLQVAGTGGTIASSVATSAASDISVSQVYNTNGVGSYIDMRSYGGSAAGTIFGNSVAGAAAIVSANTVAPLMIGTQAGNSALVFATNNLEWLRLTAAGNLGVGTSAPGSKLDVNGTINTGKASTTNGALQFSNNSNANTATVNSGATSTTYTLTLPTAVGTAGQALTINSLSGTTATMGWSTPVSAASSWLITGNGSTTASSSAIGTAANNNFIGTTNAIPWVMATSGYERMRIASAGNIGIQTTAPSALLDINTSAAANAFNVTTGNVVNVSANALTTGTALNVNSTGTITSGGTLATFTGNSATTGNILSLSGTGLTTGSVISATAGTTTGNAESLTYNSITTGNGINLSANGLTTGNGIAVASSSTGITSGSLLNLSSTGAIANASGSLLNIKSTATNTAGYLATIIGNSSTTAGIANISGTGLTTGTALNVASSAFGINSVSTSTTTGQYAAHGSIISGKDAYLGYYGSASAGTYAYANPTTFITNTTTGNSLVVYTTGASSGTAIVSVAGSSGNGGTFISNSTSSSNVGVNAQAQNSSGTGVSASGNNLTPQSFTVGAGGGFTGSYYGLGAYGSTVANGIGVAGLGNGITTATVPANGAGGVFNGTYLGEYGEVGATTNTGSSYLATIAGNEGLMSASGTNSNLTAYQFGSYGEKDFYNQNGHYDLRSGGVLGTLYDSHGLSVTAWGSLGYFSSGSTAYGVYASTALGSTAGLVQGASSAPATGFGIGAAGGMMGAIIQGGVYGATISGDRYGMYVDGAMYTNKPIVQLIDNGTKDRTVSYSVSSLTADVYAHGKGRLVNGKAIIQFDDNYQQLVDETDIAITVTPLGDCNGIHLTESGAKGFALAENSNAASKTPGVSNTEFTWIAVAKRKDVKAADIASEVVSKSFDRNIRGVLSETPGTNSTPMWWNGTTVSFTQPADNILANAPKAYRPETKKVGTVKIKE